VTTERAGTPGDILHPKTRREAVEHLTGLLDLMATWAQAYEEEFEVTLFLEVRACFSAFGRRPIERKWLATLKQLLARPDSSGTLTEQCLWLCARSLEIMLEEQDDGIALPGVHGCLQKILLLSQRLCSGGMEIFKTLPADLHFALRMALIKDDL
jgi:hypothetical protein